jgi:hypothetical protein
MASYTIRFREGGSVVLEGTRLHATHQEGSNFPVIFIFGSDGRQVAVLPGDAVKAVYLKEAEKETEGGPIAM